VDFYPLDIFCSNLCVVYRCFLSLMYTVWLKEELVEQMSMKLGVNGETVMDHGSGKILKDELVRNEIT